MTSKETLKEAAEKYAEPYRCPDYKNKKSVTFKTNVLYLIGRPEVSPSGRFGKRVTTFTTAIVNDNGEIVYGQQSYSSLGKLGTPDNAVKVTKAEFEKMIKNSQVAEWQTQKTVMRYVQTSR